MIRALLVVAAAGGCYRPDFKGDLLCSDEGTCPPGHFCALDGHCMKNGEQMDARTVVDGPPQDALRPCTLYPQSGCLPTSKCTVDVTVSTSAPVCTSSGNGAIGATCTSGTPPDDTCGEGLACLVGSCHAFCGAAASDTCGNGDACTPVASATFCMTPCDPLNPACPAAGGNPQNCYQTVTGGVCVQGSGIAIGTACVNVNDCVAGAGCVSNVCRKYCNYAVDTDVQGSCNVGQTCQQFIGNVGACK